MIRGEVLSVVPESSCQPVEAKPDLATIRKGIATGFTTQLAPFLDRFARQEVIPPGKQFKIKR